MQFTALVTAEIGYGFVARSGWYQSAESLSKCTLSSSHERAKSSCVSCTRVLTLMVFPNGSCLIRPPRSSWRRQHMGRLIFTVSFMMTPFNQTAY
jgi:hypothetical protein